MHRRIFWSPLAENDFENILLYLQEHWQEKVIENFIEITEIQIGQIAMNPMQFPLIYKKKKVRKCVITKHNSLYYKVGRDSIDILRIFDTRQNPKLLKFK
jgi:plasmid stabilization system protein ParE